MRQLMTFCAVVPCFLALAASSRAEETAQRQNGALAPAQDAAAAGLVLPSVLAPSLFRGHAFGVARAGYDSATRSFKARAAAESSPLDGLAVRVEFEHGAITDARAAPEDRVRIGARLGLLRQDGAGIDAGVAAFYDPKDFRSEGNLVLGVSVGRDWGPLGVIADVLVGSDPEGDDQNLELRLAPLVRASQHVTVGIDSRLRKDVSSDEKRAGTRALDWDLEALPTLSVAAANVVFVLDAGLRAVRSTGPVGSASESTHTALGTIAMAGAGGAF